jgi:hypothetical protein
VASGIPHNSLKLKPEPSFRKRKIVQMRKQMFGIEHFSGGSLREFLES